MSFYGTTLYSTFFYGANEFNNPPGGPDKLNAYQNVDGSIVLYWGLDPCPPAFDDFDWIIETDLDPNFNSSKLRAFTTAGNPDFIDGAIHKGLVVPAYRREQGVPTTMYWRVKGDLGGAETTWSYAAFVIPDAIDQVVRQEMLDTLPDVIFKKDFAAGDFQVKSIVFDTKLVTGNTYAANVNGTPISVPFGGSSDTTMGAIAAAIAAVTGIAEAVVVTKPGTDDDREIRIRANEKDMPIMISGSVVTGGAVQAQTEILLRNSTNINRLYDAFGREDDLLYINTVLTNNDLFAKVVRDASLRKNFGILLDIEQPATMKTIDFREIIRALLREAGNTPSYGAVKRVIKAMYCEEPSFTLIRDTLGMYVNDPSSTPPVSEFWVDDPGSIPPVDPETVWDDHNLAFGVIIEINNPIGITLPIDFVQKVVSKLVPIHAPVYIVGV